MEYFRPDVKVGVFIFVVLVLLLVGAITIGGVGDWFAATQQYTVLLPNANLLRRRAQVSYAGSPVGAVTAVMVHSNTAWKQAHPGYPVAVTIVVREEVGLRSDARVELRTDGLIGERYLDIVPGSGPPLPPAASSSGPSVALKGLLPRSPG
jgi:phospholipid/cholesterol/gamma-HCH transport system substrate-binding protein